MSELGNAQDIRPLSVLRQFVRRRGENASAACELCSIAIPADHQHLLELGKRNVVCTCDACALLFSSQAAPRYRRIPRGVRVLRDFELDDHLWESLLIPINLAFFFYSSERGRIVAYYPSPAGATESLLDLEYWAPIVERNPMLKRLEPDVETLLVNRIHAPAQYYIAPIDHCYRLVGLIRKHWHGFSGGAEVWKEIDSFFATLNTGAQPHTHHDSLSLHDARHQVSPTGVTAEDRNA